MTRIDGKHPGGAERPHRGKDVSRELLSLSDSVGHVRKTINKSSKKYEEFLQDPALRTMGLRHLGRKVVLRTSGSAAKVASAAKRVLPVAKEHRRKH